MIVLEAIKKNIQKSSNAAKNGKFVKDKEKENGTEVGFPPTIKG